MRQQAGLTLIELMVVVAILAIIAAIAIPSYNAQTTKSKRYAAQAAMTAYSARLERILASQPNTGYGFVDNDASTLTDAQFFSADLRRAYTFAVGRATPNDDFTFSITATPVTGTSQEGDDCGTLSLNHAGGQTSSSGSNCWK